MTDPDKKIEALLQRVDELESRAALRDLVSDYCIGFDNHDLDRFMSVWHEDGLWEIGPPFGTFTGHAEIKQSVEEILYPFWRETHHLTTNLRLSFIDADHATGKSNCDCMGASNEGGVVQVVNASYNDDFKRRDGIWKIARRQVDLHFFNPLPGVEMSAPESA